MRSYLKLLCAILAALTNQAFGANFISDRIEQDGVSKNIQDPITGYAPITVALTDPSISGKWTLEVLDRGEFYRSVPDLESTYGLCTINPEILLGLVKEGLWKEYDADLNRDMFLLRLSFTADSGKSESVILRWGLVPTRPVISDITFTYVYDWEWDDIWPNGNFTFKVEYLDAERIEYNVTASFLFGPPFYFTTRYVIDSPSPVIIEYDADWGEFIQVSVGNSYGSAHSDIICTTDYITDQEILDRIQEIAGIEEVKGDGRNPLLSTEDSTLSFTEPVDVSVYDLSGKQILSAGHIQTVQLSSLKSGIYIISYRNRTKNYNLKYHKK